MDVPRCGGRSATPPDSLRGLVAEVAEVVAVVVVVVVAVLLLPLPCRLTGLRCCFCKVLGRGEGREPMMPSRSSNEVVLGLWRWP